MKKVTKTIKLLSQLSEEEKAEVAEFFKQEEEPKKEEETKVEPKKEEVVVKEEEPKKEVVKEEKEKYDFESMFKKLQEDFSVVVKEVKDLKEQKASQVGIKAKPKTPSEENSFDSIFNKLTSGQ